MTEHEPIVYLNGEFVPIGDAEGLGARPRVHLRRRRVRGDPRLRTARRSGSPHHLRRLQHEPQRHPASPTRWTTSAVGRAIVRDLVARQPFDDQAVYLQVTRGVAKRDHAFPKGVPPTVFMMSNPLSLPTREQVERGVAVVTADDNRWLRCDLKTTSLLGNVLMRQSRGDVGAVETVMFRDGLADRSLGVERADRARRHHRRAAEGPPDPARHHLRRGARVRARGGAADGDPPGARAEALAADEMWLSSSTKEVLAITTVDGRPFGGGAPGPMFRRMYARSRRTSRPPRWWHRVGRLLRPCRSCRPFERDRGREAVLAKISGRPCRARKRRRRR